MQRFDLEDFGVLDWRSLMGGGRLRKVVAHGSSTVRLLPCWASPMRREHPYITAHFLSSRPIKKSKADRNFFNWTSTVCKNLLSR